MSNIKTGVDGARIIRAGMHRFDPAGTKWHVDGWWEYNSFGFLVAPPKVGKTWFALLWSICVAAGIPFLGFRTKQSPVLIFSPEGPRDQFHDRINQICNRLGIDPLMLDLHIIEDVQRIWLNDTKHQQFILDAIAETNAGFVIFDPFERCHKGPFVRDEEVQPSTEFLDFACREFNTSFMCLHHTSKADVKIENRTPKGAGLLLSSATSLLYLDRNRERIQLYGVTKNGEPQQPLYLKLNSVNGSAMLEHAGEETVVKVPNLRERIVLALLKAETRMTNRDLIDAVGGDLSKYKNIKESLQNEGFLKIYKAGGMILTKAGKRYGEELGLVCSPPIE